MYHSVSVAKLSDTQKSRLRNGHSVRIKKGNGNKIHITAEQLKKLDSAHKKGCGCQITFHPEQAEKHASGLFGDIATKLKKMAVKHKDVLNPVIRGVKAGAHKGVAKLSTAAHNIIDSVNELQGEGIKKKRGRPAKGKGIIGDVLKGIIGVSGLGVKPKAKKTTKKTTKGKGAKKTAKKTTRKGKGLASSALKAIAPILIDAASNAVKSKISGSGSKKRRGRPRKHNGGALMPAGL